MPRHLIALLAAGALLLVGAPAASAASETSTSGPVTATFSYKQGSADDLLYRDLKLKIVRNGVVALDAPILSGDCEYGCWPAGPALEGRPSVHVRDLDADGEPEVIVDMFTGGAHCCLLTQVFALQKGPASDLAPSYSRVEHNFLDPGYSFDDLDGDGVPEFVSADGRFAYAISSFAGSGFPVQVWRFGRGGFSDVTREFPALIREESNRQWRVYRSYRRLKPPGNDPALGALAAWAGDEYLLGHGRRVQRELKRALRSGRLDGFFGSGKRTLRNLNRLLAQTGYR